MDDIIIRTRLHTLKKNIQEILNFLESIKKQRRETQKLIELLTNQDIQDAQETLLENISSTQSFLGKCLAVKHCKYRQSGELKQTLDDLKKSQEAAEKLGMILGQIVEIVKGIQKRAIKIGEERGAAIPYIISSKLNLKLRDLEKIELSVATVNLNQVWLDFKIIEEECEPVFTEYINFLHGLATRETGFDSGICQFADRLLDDVAFIINQVPFNSLTIPDRYEKMSHTLASLIHMGFPEWSIWMLPLAVGEFGHVVASLNPPIKDFIKTNSQDNLTEEQLQQLVADAFGTFTMGPAYAFSVILLRFDPLYAYSNRNNLPSEDRRFHVILTMLKIMNEEPDVERPYTGFIQFVSNQWKAALLQVQPPGTPLTHQEIAQIENWTKNLRDVFWEQVWSRYPYKDWIEVRQLFQDWMCQNTKIPDSLEKIIRMKALPRHVLNAAWSTRIINCPGSPPENIAKAALELWKKIEQEQANLVRRPSDRYGQPTF